MATFENKFRAIKALCNKILFPVSLVLITGALFGWFGGSTGFITGSTMVLITCIIDSLWFVPTGYVGVLTVTTKQKNKSYQASSWPYWKIPILSTVQLVNVQEKSIVFLDDHKKTVTRNELKNFKATFSYTLNPENGHWVTAKFKGGYQAFEDLLKSWVDGGIDQAVGQLSYEHFQWQRAEVTEWMRKIIMTNLYIQISQTTQDIESSFATILYTLEAECDSSGNVLFEEVVVDAKKGTTEKIVKMKIREDKVDLHGVNLFSKISLTINSYNFEENYEKAKAGVKVAEAGVEQARLEKEQAEIKAEALKIAIQKKGEAEAAAYRKRLAAIGGNPDVLARLEMADAIRKKEGTLVIGGNATPLINP